jgi:hypothetical protein
MRSAAQDLVEGVMACLIALQRDGVRSSQLAKSDQAFQHVTCSKTRYMSSGARAVDVEVVMAS